MLTFEEFCNLNESVDISVFQKQIENKYKEEGLKSFHVYLSNNNMIHLQTLMINKENQKSGVGTKIMEELIAFADKNGLDIDLTTGVRDSYSGTTSMERLKKFYKRFGFVENKGRNKDFTISGNMFRLHK